MQSVSSRIWTPVAVSISYDNNHYTTGISNSFNINNLFAPLIGYKYKRLSLIILFNINNFFAHN